MHNRLTVLLSILLILSSSQVAYAQEEGDVIDQGIGAIPDLAGRVTSRIFPLISRPISLAGIELPVWGWLVLGCIVVFLISLVLKPLLILLAIMIVGTVLLWLLGNLGLV